MKKLLLLLASVGLFAVGCQNNLTDETIGGSINDGTTITVSLNDTRISLGEKDGDGYPVYWDNGDKLVVNGELSEEAQINAENKSSATFQFSKVLSHPFHITYPYCASTTAKTPIVEFPAEQAYTEGTFASGYAPMCGYAESKSNAISLCHLAGVLRFPVIAAHEGVVLEKVVITSQNKIAGEFTVDCQNATISATEGCGNTVTYTLPANYTLSTTTPSEFFITLPAVELGACTIEFVETSGGKMVANWSMNKPLPQGIVREFKTITYKQGATISLPSFASEEDEFIIEKPLVNNNKIHYTATQKVEPYDANVFGANIVSNEWYETTGQGVITFDGEVTLLGERCFYYNTHLTSITIPNSVLLIDKYAFESCSNLTEIYITQNVKSIGNYAFAYCNNLKTVTLNKELSSIGNGAFNGCSSLLDIILPSNITTISRELFYGCTALANITLPKQLKKIDTWAFYGCGNLKSITIPASLTFIDSNAFERAGTINVYVDNLSSWFNLTFANQFANPVRYGKLYYNGELLENIVIPNSIKEIKNYALYSVQSVKTITIPSSVTKIGIEAFSDCYNISEIYCKSSYPPQISDSNIFGRFYSYKGTIYVPASDDDSIINAYKSANVWSNYATYIKEYDFTE